MAYKISTNAMKKLTIMMLLAALAPEKPALTLGILVVFFAAMNLILFRSKIFRKGRRNSGI